MSPCWEQTPPPPFCPMMKDLPLAADGKGRPTKSGTDMASRVRRKLQLLQAQVQRRGGGGGEGGLGRGETAKVVGLSNTASDCALGDGAYAAADSHGRAAPTRQERLGG